MIAEQFARTVIKTETFQLKTKWTNDVHNRTEGPGYELDENMADESDRNVL